MLPTIQLEMSCLALPLSKHVKIKIHKLYTLFCLCFLRAYTMVSHIKEHKTAGN
jgi:hypothetical protein